MGQRSIRFPDELEARVEAVAKRDDRSFSYVVTKTVERALEAFLELRELSPVPDGEGNYKKASDVRAPVEKGSSGQGAIGPVAAPSRPAPEARPYDDVEVHEQLQRDYKASRPAFKCPVSPCTFTAKSPAAKCGVHGRTVVPV